MGWPKWALRDRRGQTLLRHQVERALGRYAEILVAGGPPGQAEELSRLLQAFSGAVRVLPDGAGWSGQGPLVALEAGLSSSASSWLALLGVDQPDFPLEAHHHLYRCRQGEREVCPESSQTLAITYRDFEGVPQWACGLFHRSLTGRCRGALDQGERSLYRFANSVAGASSALPTSLLEDLPEVPFQSLNTPEQASRAGWFRAAGPISCTDSPAGY